MKRGKRGNRLGKCGFGTAEAGAVRFLSGASLESLFGFGDTVAGTVIGGIGSEFTYMGKTAAFDHKRLKQPPSMWIVQLCLFILLWIIRDSESWQIFAIILVAILANSYDFLRKLFTMTREYDRQRNNKE